MYLYTTHIWFISNNFLFPCSCLLCVCFTIASKLYASSWIVSTNRKEEKAAQTSYKMYGGLQVHTWAQIKMNVCRICEKQELYSDSVSSDGCSKSILGAVDQHTGQGRNQFAANECFKKSQPILQCVITSISVAIGSEE